MPYKTNWDKFQGWFSDLVNKGDPLAYEKNEVAYLQEKEKEIESTIQCLKDKLKPIKQEIVFAKNRLNFASKKLENSNEL